MRRHQLEERVPTQALHSSASCRFSRLSSISAAGPRSLVYSLVLFLQENRGS